MQTILFNFASRSRPDKFRKVVNSIHRLCKQPYIILAKIDEDDPKLPEYFKAENVQYALGKSENKIHAINRDIPPDGWDIILDVSDDFIFTALGFDQIIRGNCGPDDFVHFPEPFADSQAASGFNERISVMYCAGKQYYDRLGYIYNPVYKSLFPDNEATAVAKATGRYKLVEQDIFFHAHHLAGYGKKDDQAIYTNSFYEEDKKTYNERKAINFGL